MIREVIVTTASLSNNSHIAPMGIKNLGEETIIMPFRPSTTLDNLMETGLAAINHIDDVRIFAGCLTGHREWPLVNAEKIHTKRLKAALSHAEVEVTRIENDELRPKVYCRIVHQAIHAPFQGFNRAQHAVLEAAILVSRLDRLSWRKINQELEYLRIGLDKTAGDRELEAWQWLMEAIEDHNQHPEEVSRK
ncbi:MAG: DUF447 domain-containing protein [Methylococcales bacterium]